MVAHQSRLEAQPAEANAKEHSSATNAVVIPGAILQ